MNESWLHIISWPVITYYYCYYTVITLLLRINASFIIMYHYNFFLTLLLHHYYILLHHSLLLSITFSVITLLLHHYYILLQLLHIITYSLLPIVTKSLSQVITSLLHHYYIIITSLFPIAKTGNNELIITYYALSLFSLLHCYYPLLSLLPIITCYQRGNLQMQYISIPTNTYHFLHLAENVCIGNPVLKKTCQYITLCSLQYNTSKTSADTTHPKPLQHTHPKLWMQHNSYNL